MSQTASTAVTLPFQERENVAVSVSGGTRETGVIRRAGEPITVAMDKRESMPTAQATGMIDTVTFPRTARGRSRTLVAGLALFLLFGSWLVVISDNTRLRTLVTAKTASYLRVTTLDVALRASPLPDGRSPPSRYVTSLARRTMSRTSTTLLLGSPMRYKEETAVLLAQERDLPLCRIIGLTTPQAPGTRSDVTAVVQYAGFLGAVQTLTIGVSLADSRFPGPWGAAPAAASC